MFDCINHQDISNNSVFCWKSLTPKIFSFLEETVEIMLENSKKTVKFDLRNWKSCFVTQNVLRYMSYTNILSKRVSITQTCFLSKAWISDNVLGIISWIYDFLEISDVMWRTYGAKDTRGQMHVPKTFFRFLFFRLLWDSSLSDIMENISLFTCWTNSFI